MKNKYFTKVLFVCFLGFLMSFSTKAQEQKALESITIDELKNHMYFLASDYLKGRVSYEPEYKVAAEYCFSQFKSFGLKPIFKNSEGELTYFQEVPLVIKTFSDDCSLTLKRPGSEIMLKHQDDFKIPAMYSDYDKGEMEVVFAGYGINEEKYKWNDFKGLDIENKAVIILMDAPLKNDKPVLPDEIHKSYLSFDGFTKKIKKIMNHKPAALIIIADEITLKTVPWEHLPTLKKGEKCFYDGKNKKDMTFAIPPVYVIKPEVQEKIFSSSDYSPENIKTKGLKGYKTFEFKELKIQMSFKVSDEKKILSNNIVGYVEGTDDVLKNEFITVGAHLDHLPVSDGKIFNGADDNASGTIGVLEAAEAMIKNPPKRSVMFIIYTAEELGLFGSSHFVNNPPVPINNIKFNINLDMIGRTIPENKETKAHRVVIYDEYFNKIKKFIEDENSKSINWPLAFINAKDKQGDSDHTSFHKKGIASFQFASGHHKDYHQSTDDAENIDFDKMQKIIQLTYIIANKLGNTEVLDFKEKSK